MLDVAGVGAEKKSAEEENVIVNERGLAAALPERPGVARRGRKSDRRGDGEGADVVEMFGDEDADAGGDEHDAEPCQKAQIGIDADSVAALGGDELRGRAGFDESVVAETDQLRFQ